MSKIHSFLRRCDFESGQGLGTRSNIPRLRVAQSTKNCGFFVKTHVVYIIMILIFCVLRIRKHYFASLIRNFPKRKGIIEIDWTAHESLLCLGTYFELEKYLLIEN